MSERMRTRARAGDLWVWRWCVACGALSVGILFAAGRARAAEPASATLAEDVASLQRENAALHSEVDTLRAMLRNAPSREEFDALRREMEALRARGAGETWGPVQETVSPEAVAPPGAWYDKLTVKGRSYMRYSYELQSRKDFNEFDLDRIYVELLWDLWENGRVVYVMEGGGPRMMAGTGPLDVATKAFFLEIRDLIYPSTYLWLGQADLPWVAYEEGLWGYRFQGTVFPDREGYMTSTDLGIGFGGLLHDDYGSWQVSLVNGEGWDGPEMGKHKNFHARLTVNPLAAHGEPWSHVFVTGFGAVGNYDGIPGHEDARNRYIAQAGFHEPGRWTLVGEYLWTEDPASVVAMRQPSLVPRTGAESDGEGFSIFGTLNLGVFHPESEFERWELIGRWDHMDPDDQIADNEHDRWIVGVSRRWNQYLQTLLAWEGVDYDSGAMLKDESRLMAQAELRF